mgnify:CR=1 FL=1
MWRHLFLMIFEVANAPRKIHRTNWRNHFTVKNNRALMELMLGARPIVMVSGHFGNFEMASFMAGLLGFPSYTIARPLDNPYLDRYVNSFRGMHGQFIVTKQGSSGQLNRILSEGGKIAMLGDQAAGPRGCWVDFLGRPASCHKAVSLFTLTSGAPLLVCYTRRRQHPLDFELGLVAAADPEVDDDRIPVRLDENILGFEVAMNDLGFMSRMERIAHLGNDRHRAHRLAVLSAEPRQLLRHGPLTAPREGV